MTSGTGGRNTSVRCNGKLLRNLRQEHNLSQAEFARKSGWSLRLIQKGEASQWVRPETIHGFVGTLNDCGCNVSFRDLCIDENAVIGAFLDLYETGVCESGIFVENMTLIVRGRDDLASSAAEFLALRELLLSEFKRLDDATVVVAKSESDSQVLIYIVDSLLDSETGRRVTLPIMFRLETRPGLITAVECLAGEIA